MPFFLFHAFQFIIILTKIKSLISFLKVIRNYLTIRFFIFLGCFFIVIPKSFSQSNSKPALDILKIEKLLYKQTFEREQFVRDINFQPEEPELLMEKQNNRQNLLIIILVILIGAMLVLTIYLFQKLKMTKILSEKNKEISQKKDELENLNKIIEEQKISITNRNIILEKEVAKRTKGIVDYNQRLEQFAFIIAHNMRAPVARILGLGSIIRNKLYENKEFDYILDKVFEQTGELDRVLREVNDILDLRNSSDEIFNDINIREQLNFTKKLLKNEIRYSKANISIDIDKNMVFYTVRPYIQNIFYNLISNALKYQNPNVPPEINVSVYIESDKLIVQVQDNGLGIDLEQNPQDQLFKLYNRLHTHVGGRGLGLFIVKTQIDILKGYINVTSKLGKGTCFTISLPNLKNESTA